MGVDVTLVAEDDDLRTRKDKPCHQEKPLTAAAPESHPTRGEDDALAQARLEALMATKRLPLPTRCEHS
jgi:hypothetical protein